MCRQNEAGVLTPSLCLLTLAAFLMFAPLSFAAESAAVFPTGVTFNPQTSGTISIPQTVTVYNIGSVAITVTAATSNVAQFVVNASLPVTIQPMQWSSFSVTFNPVAGKTYSGQLTVTITGLPPQKVTLSGVGMSTTAIATPSTTSLSFPSQPLGTTSGTQTVTITNTGTSTFKVNAVTLTYPFTQTGFSGTATQILKGQSLTMQVSYFPISVGATNGTMLITYDSLAPQGVSLTGTASAPISLAATTNPLLPTGTQNAAYQAVLTAQAGSPPYTWSLASGSTLPLGLSLSSGGFITGTFDASVGAGNYSFTVTVTDSNASSINSTFTLPVGKPIGSVCNNISINASDGSGPLVDLIDLGTGYYLGAEQGGLYASGSNIRPADHDTSGITLAGEIQPLDSNGNPSPMGKIGFLSIGESVAQQPFIKFMSLASVDPSINRSIVFVNGATGGATASYLAAPGNNFWNVINVDYLPNAGITPLQVQVAWVNDVNGGPSGTFPADMTKLQGNFQSIAQNLYSKFPNIKIAYYSSINYTGYSNGIKNLSNEPWSYEAGFATKNAILDQINGDPNMNFDSSKGKVKAPWIDWGPYYWANGMNPRSDGLVWACQDLQADGTHPSDPAGRLKVSTQLLNFLKSDDTASIWFLAH